MPAVLRASLAVFALALALPGGALAATSAGQPFPTNLYTTPTPRRSQVCASTCRSRTARPRRRDCADIAVLDTLDGFNIQPRISIPFSGPIDLSTVTSSNIFLVGPGGHVVGINQAVWEPAANTLHVESDQQLAQDTTYLLVVTRGVHDANGKPLDATTFQHDLNFGQTKDPADEGLSEGADRRAADGDGGRRRRRRHRRGQPLHDAEHQRDLEEDPRAAHGRRP